MFGLCTSNPAQNDALLMRPFAADPGGATLSLIVVYAGAYVALVFAALCLAAGVSFIAELIEEHSRLAKRIIRTGLVGLLVLHPLLLLDQPPLPVLLSTAAHLAYVQLLSRFPSCSLSSPTTILAALLGVSSNALWLKHFYFDTYASLHFSLGFLAVVAWLAPSILLLSLTSDGSPVLPTGNSLPPFAAAALAREAAAARARGESLPETTGRRKHSLGAGLRGILPWFSGVPEKSRRRE